MKKPVVFVNHEDKTLTVSKAFYKKASIYGTPEYNELKAAMRDNEGYGVEFKTSEKKTYKNLNFKRMEDYIKTQPDSEAKLMEFEAVKMIAEAKGSKYPLTKKWFLLTYPEYKENEVSRSETETLTNEAKEKAVREAEAKLALIEGKDAA